MRVRPLHGPAVLAVLLLAGSSPAGADEEAAAIVARAFEAARANEAAARQYVFHERVEERRFDRQGEETKRESKTWDVTLFEGSDYRRLIAKNDRPLDPRTEAKEQRRLDKHLRKLQNETPAERARRLAKVEKERREGEEFLEEITKAFDFRLLGEEEIEGIATWVIAAEPRPGYRPPSRIARVLTKLRATLWVSREDDAWVQADIETFDDFGWLGLYKLRSGTQVEFRQQQLDGEVWVTEWWNARLRARIALVYRIDAEVTGTYSNFQRFTTETTVTGWSPADEGTR